MKRIIILLFAVISSTAIWAQTFFDAAEVYVNGTKANTTGFSVVITRSGANYNVTLKNLKVNSTVLGDLELKGITPESPAGPTVLLANQDVTFKQGSTAGAIGPDLGPQPVKMAAITDSKTMIAHYTIDMTASRGELIDVLFGEDMLTGKNFHVPNGDFELWHTTTEGYIAPNAWHTFEDATGNFASMGGHHVKRLKNYGRNYSACVSIVTTEESISLMGTTRVVIANGTLTTGRLNCGSFAPTDTKNNTNLDMSVTDLDGNGDPFYVTLNHRPDSLVTWLQFTQVKAVPEHPWCVMSATVTDGTYYQEPEGDVQYTNIVCKALNHDITTTGGQWKRISIPFDYTSYPYGAQPKAIMITVSTNAYKGAGQAGDEVLLDDLTLVYNHRLRKLTGLTGFSPDKFDYEVTNDININDLNAVADGKESHVLISEKPASDGKYIYVDVYAADLKSVSTYSIHCKTGTGIAVTTKAEDAGIDTYYNLGGQRISAPKHGQVTIVKTADGRTIKAVNK